jgi:hypothetical protein
LAVGAVAGEYFGGIRLGGKTDVSAVTAAMNLHVISYGGDE